MSHQEIVKRLLESKVVDFAAIGKFVAEVGPSLAVANEPWDGICGTGRHYVRIYRIFGPGVPSPVDPVDFGGAGRELNQ